MVCARHFNGTFMLGSITNLTLLPTLFSALKAIEDQNFKTWKNPSSGLFLQLLFCLTYHYWKFLSSLHPHWSGQLLKEWQTTLDHQITKARRKTANQHETFCRPVLVRNRLVQQSTEKSDVQWMLMILFPVQHFCVVLKCGLGSGM